MIHKKLKTKVDLKIIILSLTFLGALITTPVFANIIDVQGTNQTKTQVTGKVVDEQNNAIIGASVKVKGSNLGVITDTDGNFVINVASNATLEISYVGYKTIEVSVNGKRHFDVKMTPTSETLGEVVVVGYGTQKKVNLTGSVQTVSSQQLTQRNVPTISTALQGLVPGAVVTQSSGAPGASAGIQIRGTGSINADCSPLILIDGVEGDMDSIDMNSVESISVLKDAASASIYGSRASGGVILVTTKRAAKGELRVSYDGYVGFRTPTKMPHPANALEYMNAINVASANADANLPYSQEVLDIYKTKGADNYNYFDTDWKGLLFKDNTLTHNHSLSISGGNDNIKTFLNAGYNYEDGLIPNNFYTRSSLRSNTDFKINNWISGGVDINLRRTKFLAPSAGSVTIIQECLTYAPVFSGVNDDGTWGFGQNGVNPIAQDKAEGIGKSYHSEVALKGFIKVNPMKGLEGIASYYRRRYEYKGESYVAKYDTYEGGVFKTSYPTQNSSSEGWEQDLTNQFNAQLTYENTFFGKHYMKAMAGFQTEEMLYHGFSGSRQNFNYPGFWTLDNGDISTAKSYGSKSEVSDVSWFGRINYAYADRYLLELDGRYDGSSRFLPAKRWGFFPSVSVGWRISEEPFFKPLKSYVDNLKLRVSYGTLGNEDIGSYPYASNLYVGAGYWYNENYVTGVYTSQVANSNITWEKSKQTNFGLDLTALQSRLNLTFDYYIRNISDMLQTFPIPMFVGLGSSWQNAGSMRDNGWDMQITWRDHIGDFKYHITANLADVKNKVTNLYGNKYINSNNSTQEGHPVFSYYGYVADGYFQSQSEIDATPVYGGVKTNVKPGFIKYKDISGPDGVPDGVIDTNDRTFTGCPQSRYTFSADLGAQWKNFDVSVFLQGVGKKDIYFEGYGARPFYIGRTIYHEQMDYWTPENTHSKYPLLLIDGTGNNMNNMPSSFWVRSGAYMRLKNVTLGYTLPKSIVQKLNMESLRLYISGQNLLTIAHAYPGYDPETSIGSFYPLMQIYTFGVNVKF